MVAIVANRVAFLKTGLGSGPCCRLHIVDACQVNVCFAGGGIFREHVFETVVPSEIGIGIDVVGMDRLRNRFVQAFDGGNYLISILLEHENCIRY